MSDSLQPQRRQPTRLPRPWDSPGKNTGVGRHFLLQCMKVKSESVATQLSPTLRDPMDCGLPGSSHGIFQARVLEWVAIAFSHLDWLQVPNVTKRGLFPFPEFARKITSDGNPVQSENQQSGIGGKWVSSSVPFASYVCFYRQQFSQDMELFHHHKELLPNPLQSHSLLP